MTILVAAGLQLLGAFSSIEAQCLSKGAFFGGFQPTEEYNTAAFTHSACVPEFNPRNLFTFTKFDFADVRLICQITNNYFKLYFNSVIKICIYMPKITNI